MKNTMRLDKYLADMGIGTRSEVKDYIKKGRIILNGVPACKPDIKVDLVQDQVMMDGREISYVTKEYFLLNKPAGVISASSDPKARTVVDLIEDAKRKDLFPVGRLDKDTEGLLIITNDGELAHQLLSPKKHVDKTYFAKVYGKVTDENVKQFKQGLVVDEELTCLPAELELLSVRQLEEGELETIIGSPERMEELGLAECVNEKPTLLSDIRITIREGKYHQIKRMFEAVGKKVVYLKRISMGSLTLGDDLPIGEYRTLTEKEIKELYR